MLLRLVGAAPVEGAEAEDRVLEAVLALVLLDVQLGRLLRDTVERAGVADDVDRGGEDESLRPGQPGRLEQVDGAADVDRGRVAGAVARVADVGEAGEVVDGVVTGDRSRTASKSVTSQADERLARPEVRRAARGRRRSPRGRRPQCVGDVAADEARAAGDERPHGEPAAPGRGSRGAARPPPSPSARAPLRRTSRRAVSGRRSASRAGGLRTAPSRRRRGRRRARCPSRSASASASSSSTSPRAVSTMTAPGLIRASCSRAEDGTDVRRLRGVDRDDVGVGEQAVEGRDRDAVRCRPGGVREDVVAEQLDAERLEEAGDALADAAEADDADRLAAEQAAHLPRPAALAQLTVHAVDMAEDGESPPSVSSAAAWVTASGVLKTAMPSRAAAVRSTLSVPTPTREIARSRGAPSSTCVVSGSVPAMRPSASRRSSAISASLSVRPCGILEQPRARTLEQRSRSRVGGAERRYADRDRQRPVVRGAAHRQATGASAGARPCARSQCSTAGICHS